LKINRHGWQKYFMQMIWYLNKYSYICTPFLMVLVGGNFKSVVLFVENTQYLSPLW